MFTDNILLKYLNCKAQTSPKELRWYETIISTDLKLIHKLDRDNLVLDVLSWREDLVTLRLLTLVEGGFNEVEKNS